MMKSLGSDYRDYLWTVSGKRINILNPRPEDFDIEDIAIGLGRECRFSNQTKVHYSVAEHSILVCALSPKPLQLHSLLHDGPEFLIKDFPRPLKYHPEIYKVYAPIEEAFMKAIAIRFGFEYNEKTKAEVKVIDRYIVNAEIRDLMKLPEDEEIDLSNAYPYDLSKHTLTPEEATNCFLEMYHVITGQPIKKYEKATKTIKTGPSDFRIDLPAFFRD